MLAWLEWAVTILGFSAGCVLGYYACVVISDLRRNR